MIRSFHYITHRHTHGQLSPFYTHTSNKHSSLLLAGKHSCIPSSQTNVPSPGPRRPLHNLEDWPIRGKALRDNKTVNALGKKKGTRGDTGEHAGNTKLRGVGGGKGERGRGKCIMTAHADKIGEWDEGERSALNQQEERVLK